MPASFRRRRNRLPLDVYHGDRAYFLTLKCAGSRALLTERRVVVDCIEILRSSADRAGFAVIAYCFMPDHLHLLVQGDSQANLVAFVKDFKQRTGYRYRRSNASALWQKSYYDHVLRSQHEVAEVARYVVGNPVRAGLVSQARDYPFSGSFIH